MQEHRRKATGDTTGTPWENYRSEGVPERRIFFLGVLEGESFPRIRFRRRPGPTRPDPHNSTTRNPPPVSIDLGPPPDPLLWGLEASKCVTVVNLGLRGLKVCSCRQFWRFDASNPCSFFFWGGEASKCVTVIQGIPCHTGKLK